METNHLFEFRELARRLNFTATAAALNMTQPTLTNHVHALERQTGVRLIERSPEAGVSRLTPAGQQFLEYAEQIIRVVDGMPERLQRIAEEVKGELVVCLPLDVHYHPIVEYLSKFREENPKINVVLIPENPSDSIDLLRHGRIDCLCAVGAAEPRPRPGLPKGISFQRICSYELCAWVSATSPLASCETIDPQLINGMTVSVPTSWDRSEAETFVARHHLKASIVDRYCESIEDFVLSKVQPDDVVLCDEPLARSDLFSLRSDRVARTFKPSDTVCLNLVYLAQSSNKVLHDFVKHLKACVREASK